MSEATHNTCSLFAAASNDVTFDLSVHLSGDEPAPASAPSPAWYEDSVALKKHPSFHVLVGRLRECCDICNRCSLEVAEEMMLCLTTSWKPFLADMSGAHLNLDVCMELFSDVLQDLTAALKASMQEADMAFKDFKHGIQDLLKTSCASSAWACPANDQALRYAQHVVQQKHKRVRHGHCTTHSAEARQILKFWASLQQQQQLQPFKRCEKRQIQYQTGLTMRQVQDWLSNYKKRHPM